MPISFSEIKKEASYTRNELAKLWGYSSFHAIARGVVTPRGDNKIVLFITEEKQSTAEQYTDRLSDGVLECDGPTDHFGQERMINASSNQDEIHLFHRARHHSEFIYQGQLKLISSVIRADKPSSFTFQVL